MEILSNLLDSLLEILDNLYYQVNDEAKKAEIHTYYKQISKFQKKLAQQLFDKNNELFLKSIDNLKASEKNLNELKNDLSKIEEMFKYITQITMELDTLISKFSKI